MVDPQVSDVSTAIQETIEERDVRGIAVLGGVGALGVLGVREVIDRLDGRAGITADPVSAQDHAINGVAKVLFAAVVVIGLQRFDMGGTAMAFGAVFAFGALISAGGNAIDAIGRTRLTAPLQSGASVQRRGGRSSQRPTRQAEPATRTNGRRGVSA